MKQTFIVGTTIAALAVVLLGTAYAQEDKVKALQMAMLAKQTAKLITETMEITETCSLQAQFGLVTDSCMNYVKDYKSAMENLINKYGGDNMTMSVQDYNSLLGDMNNLNLPPKTKYFEP